MTFFQCKMVKYSHCYGIFFPPHLLRDYLYDVYFAGSVFVVPVCDWLLGAGP